MQHLVGTIVESVALGFVSGLGGRYVLFRGKTPVRPERLKAFQELRLAAEAVYAAPTRGAVSLDGGVLYTPPGPARARLWTALQELNQQDIKGVR